MDLQYKCAYCGYFIQSQCENYLEHQCFKQRFTPHKTFDIVADEENVLSLVESIKPIDSLVHASIATTQSYINDEALVGLVSSRRALWDFRIPLAQRNSLRLKDLWLEISNELEGNPSEHALKKRWMQLRDDFMRAKKKNKAYVPSGSATDDVPLKSSYKYYNALRFLDDTADDRKTTCNVQLQQVPSEAGSPTSGLLSSTPASSGPASSASDLLSPSTSSRKRKRTSGLEGLELQREILNQLQEPVVKPDGVDGFLILLGEMLRRLPPRNRTRMQIKFLQMVEEEENMCENN